jgi:outer membrane protein TolC
MASAFSIKALMETPSQILCFPTVGEQLNKQISFNIGLQLSWTIFDRFSTNLRAEQALINYRNQELQYEDLKNSCSRRSASGTW